MEYKSKIQNFSVELPLDAQKIQANNKCSLKVYHSVFLQQFRDMIPQVFVKLVIAV